MTNSERIAANNTRLSKLVETAESLPDAGSVEMCNVTINMSSDGTAPTRFFKTENVAINYIDENGDLVRANNITLNGGTTVGSMSDGFTITVACRCNTPLTFIEESGPITAYNVSEGITKILVPEYNTEALYAITILTPASAGNYTMNLYH